MTSFNFFKIAIVLVPACIFSKLGAEETIKRQKAATIALGIDSVEALRGFTSINFFLHTPPSARNALKKMESLVIEELKRNGKVHIEKASMESLLGKLNDENSSLRNPSLVYNLTKIDDIAGRSLPIYKASLMLRAPVTVEKNKTYCRSILWEDSLYVKSEQDQSLEKVVSETLNHFLGSFKQDYFEANQDTEIQPVFYFIE